MDSEEEIAERIMKQAFEKGGEVVFADTELEGCADRELLQNVNFQLSLYGVMNNITTLGRWGIFKLNEEGIRFIRQGGFKGETERESRRRRNRGAYVGKRKTAKGIGGIQKEDEGMASYQCDTGVSFNDTFFYFSFISMNMITPVIMPPHIAGMKFQNENLFLISRFMISCCAINLTNSLSYSSISNWFIRKDTIIQ